MACIHYRYRIHSFRLLQPSVLFEGVGETSRRDADQIVSDMFPDGLIRREVKDQIVRTIWEPHETTRVVRSRGHSSGQSHSRGESSAYGDSNTSGSGHSWSMSGDAFSQYEGQHSFGTNFMQASSSSDSYGSSLSDTESESHSEAEAIVPFYEHLRASEVSSRTFYSVEELRERFISWFLLQPKRHAQVKIGDASTVPMITTFLQEVRAREKDRQRAIDRSNQKYALPVHEVDRLIEERRVMLLTSAEEATIQESAMPEESRWH